MGGKVNLIVVEGLVPKGKTLLTNSTKCSIFRMVVVRDYYVVQDSIEG
jgi:hypothetical protein